MIFSDSKRKIRALESEVEDLKERIRELDRRTKYYTDTQLNVLKFGMNSPFGSRPYETVDINEVVKRIAKHLNMTVNISPPTGSQIEVSFGDEK